MSNIDLQPALFSQVKLIVSLFSVAFLEFYGSAFNTFRNFDMT